MINDKFSKNFVGEKFRSMIIMINESLLHKWALLKLILEIQNWY